ncbi:MAG: V-type ATPase subunit [Caldilineaceae bacterium]
MTVLLGAARYAAASARVHALFAQFMPAALWVELLDAPDVGAVLNSLHQTAYADRLARIAAAHPDVITIERVLWQHWVQMARRPFALLQGNSRELLEWYWRRQELNNLKTVLRAVHHRRRNSFAGPHPPRDSKRTAVAHIGRRQSDP